MELEWLEVDELFNSGIKELPQGWDHAAAPVVDYENALPFPPLHHYNLTGYHGWGIDFKHMLSMWPMFFFAVVWYICRTLGRTLVFNRIARLVGIRGQKKQRKFAYSLWLAFFYITSTIFGYFLFIEEPYMRFPMDHDGGIALLNNHPRPVSRLEKLYYLYECGFFIAELFAIFVEDRRSDFVEYVVHHITTILLIVLSYSSYLHRNGVYILLLHDASDIFLCVAKCFHYANCDPGVYVGFTLFTALFAWLRLYCFPHIIYYLAIIPHTVVPFMVAWWILWSLLVILQLLHVYWFALIVRMIFRLIAGTKGDVRSDEDDDEGEGSPRRNAESHMGAPKRVSKKKKN